jgi:hypothetical protein
MRGLIAARTAVMTAVAAIDADIRRMTRASAACRRLMTIPGVGQLTALAFVAAIDDPSRIRRSRDVGAYLGLVPSGISLARSTTPAGSRNAATGGCEPSYTRRPMSCGPATRASSNSRTGPSRSPSGQRCAKPESLWRAASRSSCTRCCETGQSSHRPKPGNPRDRRPNRAPKRSDAQGREQTTAWIL